MYRRRDFLKSAALAGPGLAFMGSTHEMPEAGHYIDKSQVNSARKLDNGWLNVQDCGASGSEFQTIASTVSGSRQITVADIGDFEVGQGIMVSKCNIRYTPTRLSSSGIQYILITTQATNNYETKLIANNVENLIHTTGAASHTSIFISSITLPVSSKALIIF